MLLTFAIILLPFLCRGEPATQIINPTSNEMFLLNKIEKLEDEVVDLKNKLTMILEMVRSAKGRTNLEMGKQTLSSDSFLG